MEILRQYSTNEVAERLGVSLRTVQNFCDRGHFPNMYKLDPTRRNSPWRIPEGDVEKFEAQRRQAQQ